MSLNKHPECGYNLAKIETSISVYNINNGMMKIPGLSGLLTRVIQVEI